MFYPPVMGGMVRTSFRPRLADSRSSAVGRTGRLPAAALIRARGDGLRRSPPAVYLASPFLLAHTFEGHYPHVWAAAWYPWAFWALATGATRANARSLMLPRRSGDHFPGGPSPGVVASGAGTLGLGPGRCARGLPSQRRPPGRVAALICGAAAAACRSGSSHSSWRRSLPFGPGCSATTTRSRGPSIPGRYHLEALNGLQLLSPTALGGPADYFGRDNYWETLLSIGLVPLLLATLAALRHPDRKLVRAWLVLLGLAVWFACGRHLLLYTAAYYVVPGYELVPGAGALALPRQSCAAPFWLDSESQTLATRMAEPPCLAAVCRSDAARAWF